MHTKAGRRFCRTRRAGKTHPAFGSDGAGLRKRKSCEGAIGTASAGLKVTGCGRSPACLFLTEHWHTDQEPGSFTGLRGGSRAWGGICGVRREGLAARTAVPVRGHICAFRSTSFLPPRLPSHARLDKRIFFFLANSKKCSLRRHIPGQRAGERKRCFCLFGQRVWGEEIGAERTNRCFKSTRFLPLCRPSAQRRDPGPSGQGKAERGTKASGQNAAPSGARRRRRADDAQPHRRLREAGWELGEPHKSWRQVGTERGGRAAPRRAPLPANGPALRPLLLLLPHPSARPAQLPRRQRGAALTCGARVRRWLRRGGRRNPTGGPGAARPGAERRGAKRREARGSRRARPQVAAAAGSRGGGASRQRGAEPRRAGRGAAARGSSRRRHCRAAGGAAPRAEGSGGAMPVCPKGGCGVAGGSLRPRSFGFFSSHQVVGAAMSCRRA